MTDDHLFVKQTVKVNIPIPELPLEEEVWLMVFVTSVREGRTKQGKPFRDVSAHNSTGSLALKIWSDALEGCEEIGPGFLGYQRQARSISEPNSIRNFQIHPDDD